MYTIFLSLLGGRLPSSISAGEPADLPLLCSSLRRSVAERRMRILVSQFRLVDIIGFSHKGVVFIFKSVFRALILLECVRWGGVDAPLT